MSFTRSAIIARAAGVLQWGAHYKTFRRDLSSPLLGGIPVWGGDTPYSLPLRWVDQSASDGAGWHAARSPERALTSAGLWPDGWPARVFTVEDPESPAPTAAGARAGSWTIRRELSEMEIAAAIRRLTEKQFPGTPDMAVEQISWREALARPERDERAVVAGLRNALTARGLSGWRLRRLDTPWDVWAATPPDRWERNRGPAWCAWADGVATHARRACVEATYRDGAYTPPGPWFPWSPRAHMSPWDTQAAQDAQAALTLHYAARQGWVMHDRQLLTEGLRDAYRAGLALALPAGPGELAWAMAFIDADPSRRTGSLRTPS